MCIGYLSSVAGVHRQISDMRGTLACVASPVLLRPARPALLYRRVWTWRDLSGHATWSYIYYTPYDDESKREDYSWCGVKSPSRVRMRREPKRDLESETPLRDRVSKESDSTLRESRETEIEKPRGTRPPKAKKCKIKNPARKMRKQKRNVRIHTRYSHTSHTLVLCTLATSHRI